MVSSDLKLLEKVLTDLCYQVLDRFISDYVVDDIEKNPSQLSKTILLKKSESQIKKSIKKSINSLKKAGITSLELADQNPDIVTKLMNDVQQEVMKDAETVSKK